MTKWGGTFLLQETEPKMLLGSLISGTAASGPGWVQASLFQKPGLVFFDQDGTDHQLTLGWQVALSLISLLEVLLAQNAILRGEVEYRPAAPAPVTPVVTIAIDPAPKSAVLITWSSSVDGMSWRRVEEQIEWRMREDVAASVATALVHALARKASVG